VKGDDEVLQRSNYQVASRNLTISMKVIIWLLMLHKMMKEIEVRIPPVKVQYLD
jgi:hypothetical protein